MEIWRKRGYLWSDLFVNTVINIVMVNLNISKIVHLKEDSKRNAEIFYLIIFHKSEPRLTLEHKIFNRIQEIILEIESCLVENHPY